jgi:hypothetical protein
MLRSESIMVTFESTQPNCIKIYRGATNVASGKPLPPSQFEGYQQRDTKRARWQKVDYPYGKQPCQDYIVVPAQRRIEGVTTRTGHLRRFRPPGFQDNTSIEQHFEENVMVSALRFDITPLDMKATYWLHDTGTHSTVRTETLIDLVHCPALFNMEELVHLRPCIGEVVGHECVEDARIYAGLTILNLSKDNRQCIGDLPKTNGIIELHLDMSMW